MTSRKIKVGNLHFTISPWQKRGLPYYRATYYDSQGNRRWLVRKKERDLVDHLKIIARRFHSRTLELSELPPDQLRIIKEIAETCPSAQDLGDFLTWKKSKSRSLPLGELLHRFTLAKEKDADVSAAYLRRLKSEGKRLVDTLGHSRPVADISLTELKAWFALYSHLEPKTRNNARGLVVGLWGYAVRERLCHLDDGLTIAQRLPQARIRKKSIKIYTPAQGRLLLDNVAPRWLPWLVLNGWGMVRVEELITNDPKKQPLDWSHFDWKAGKIYLPPEVAKTNEDREIDICPTVRKYLFPIAGKKGPVCNQERAPTSPYLFGADANHKPRGLSETVRLGKIVDGWLRNGLRKSAISYLAKKIGVIQTAAQAGNSESVIEKNYKRSTKQKDAEDWFNL